MIDNRTCPQCGKLRQLAGWNKQGKTPYRLYRCTNPECQMAKDKIRSMKVVKESETK